MAGPGNSVFLLFLFFQDVGPANKKGGEKVRLKRVIAFTFISLVLLTLCFSCVRSRVMPQPDINFKQTRQWDVKIYYLEPEKPYIKIGMVEAKGATLSSWKNVEKHLRKEAAKIGGDAVIILKQDRPMGAITSRGLIYRKKYLRGIVIKWKKEGSERE